MQNKRERYLDLMGIDTYQPRQPEETPADVVMSNDNAAPVAKTELDAPQDTEQVVAAVAEEVPSAISESDKVYKGLRYITKQPTNGLVVVLPSLSKQLNPEARQLMSKMLNSIQCQPAETGFAELGTETESDKLAADGIRALLILDYTAGKQFIDLNGATRVPGEDYCVLSGIPVVVSIHPQELLTTPELKSSAWRDLKLIANLIQ